MQSRVVVEKKALQQVLVQAIPVAGELMKAVLMAAEAQIQRRVTQAGMLVDQQAFSLPVLTQLESQMQRQRGDPGASLCADHRDDLSADSRMTFLLLLRLCSRQ